MQRRVILYELNEVPWDIVDLYTAARPGSHLAGLLPRAQSFTTVNEDTVGFQPWRTWPTFHTSQYTPEHGSYHLGQDPATFAGDPLWDVADAAGLRVGIFGPMQSWPAHRFRNGGFYIPDTFARSADTEPPSLRRFQEFNLAMTGENSFASDAPLPAGDLVRAGADMVAKGLTPWSAWTMAGHLVAERRDRRYTARRSAVQVLPSFDLYWRLHRRHQPHLSIFFTNHVAGMMHRYWGDGVPGYTDGNPYRADDVYRGFIVTAMDWFDHQLARVARHVDANAGTVLVIAASMGQGPIPYRDMQQAYVVTDTDRLIRAMGFRGAEVGLAMYPRTSIQFPTEGEAGAAMAPLAAVTSDGDPLFNSLELQGTTLSFEISLQFDTPELSDRVRYERGGEQVDGVVGDLGVEIRSRPGGGNTAYHVPEGMFVAYGDGLEPDHSRDKVSVLDAAPSILGLLGVEPAPSMQGEPTIFAAA